MTSDYITTFSALIVGIAGTIAAFHLKKSEAKKLDVEAMDKLVTMATQLTEDFNKKYVLEKTENETLHKELKENQRLLKDALHEIEILKEQVFHLDIEVQKCKQTH